MRRYHMHKGKWMVEHTDRAILQEFRRSQPQLFRYARIKHVLQLCPSQVPMGVIIKREGYI